jgi:hypothetical protein
LLFIIPLAFTLSGFLLWIMYSLNGVYSSFTNNSLPNSRVSHDRTLAGKETTLQTQDVHTAPLHPLIYCASDRHILRRLIHVVFGKACGRYVSIQSALHSSHP